MTAVATMSDLLDPPQPSSSFSAWRDLTRKERAHACWLALQAGWPLDTSLVSFDTDKNLLMVQKTAGLHGSVIVALCSREAEQTLARIERKFGAETLAKVEEVIGT